MSTQSQAAPPPEADERYDVAIVGGGPAGLMAARELADAGAKVAIVDENEELGGQYFKRRSQGVLAGLGDFRPAGTRLIAEVRDAGVRCITGTLVWAAEKQTLWTSDVRSGALGSIAARRLIVATGAYERSIPFPGWTLPGVCTPGFALQAADVSGVRIGRRVVVAGTGPFLLACAVALIETGCEVAAVVEVNEPYRMRGSSLSALASPRRLYEYACYRSVLSRHRVPLHQGWHVVAAEGPGRVESVTIADASGTTAQTLTVDTLCVGYGFKPNSELALLLGCKGRRDPRSGDVFPRTDSHGRSSVDHVYVAGELWGIAGAEAAMNRGRLAAQAVIHDAKLGDTSGAHDSRALARERRLEAFAHTVDRLCPVPHALYARIADETLVCRCEAITAGEVRRAAASGWSDLDGTKALTRAGMGPCQGRECGHVIAALASAVTGRAVERFHVRVPIKPIAMPRSPA